MAQSIFGMTSYEGQSLKDILLDIEAWEIYTTDTKMLFKKTIDELTADNYFNSIGYNFKAAISHTVTITESFLHDFNIVKNNIKNNLISDSDIKLLINIGNVSRQNNLSLSKDYKDDRSWFNYKEENFKKAKNLYQEGKDFFFVISDAYYAALRLEDYKTMQNNTHININGSVGNMQTGDNATMNVGSHSDSQIEVITLLTSLLDNIDNYFSDEENDKREEAIEAIEFISSEIKKQEPKKSILKNILMSLKVLSNSVTFVDTVISIGTALNLLVV